MKHGRRWIIVDTETDGLQAPIHTLEIAAQAMQGWQACGPPFQVYLNHNVPIAAAATAVHGYTRQFLQRHGIDPVQAHQRFAAYVQGDPLVCHNLSYDWDRVLVPEWQRLRLQPAGSAGFCTLLLSRRVIHETRTFGLDHLKSIFRLGGGRSHQAAADVATVVALIEHVIGPRLCAAGIDSWDDVCAFSRRTPVQRCRAQLNHSC